LTATNNFIIVSRFHVDQTFLMTTSQEVELTFCHLRICIRQSRIAFWTNTHIWRLVSLHNN